MKLPSLKEWREGATQIGVFVRTKNGETAEFRSRLIEDGNRAGIAERVALLVSEAGIGPEVVAALAARSAGR